MSGFSQWNVGESDGCHFWAVFKSHHVVLPPLFPLYHGKYMAPRGVAHSVWAPKWRQYIEQSHSWPVSDDMSCEQEINLWVLSPHNNLLRQRIKTQKPSSKAVYSWEWSYGVARWQYSGQWNISGSVGVASFLSLPPWKTAVRPGDTAKPGVCEVTTTSMNDSLLWIVEEKGKEKWHWPWTAQPQTSCNTQQMNTHLLKSVFVCYKTYTYICTHIHNVYMLSVLCYQSHS